MKIADSIQPPTKATSFFQGGISAFISSFVSIGVSMLTGIIFARVLGPSGKGSYDLILATTSLAVILLGLSLPSGITYVVARHELALGRLGISLLTILLMQTLCVGGLLVLVENSSLAPAFIPSQFTNYAVAMVTAAFFFQSGYSWLRAVLVGQQRIILVSIFDSGSRTLLLLLVILGALWRIGSSGPAPSALFIWINTATSAASGVVLVLLLRSEFGSFAGQSAVAEVVQFARVSYFGNLAQFLNYRADVFLVSLLTNIGSVGQYTLAVSLGQFVWLISNAFAFALFPRVASSQSDHAANLMRTAKVTRLSLTASVLIALAMAFVADMLLPSIYGEEFRTAVQPLLLLLPGIAIFSVANVLGSYFAGMGKPAINLKAALVGLVITIPLDLLLIPRFGISGAALTSTLSYSGTTIAMLVMLKDGGYAKVPLRDFLIINSNDVTLLVRRCSDIVNRSSKQKVASEDLED